VEPFLRVGAEADLQILDQVTMETTGSELITAIKRFVVWTAGNRDKLETLKLFKKKLLDLLKSYGAYFFLP
jgi:hypothetical protein